MTDPNGHCPQWLQSVCDVFQKAWYGIFSDYGFRTRAQVKDIQKQQTEARREWLRQNNVVTPDDKGNSIDWSKASAKQVNQGFEQAVETLAMGPFLFKLGHEATTILTNKELESIRQMSTQDIIKSLNDAASAEQMVIKPDGTVMNGNTRLFVLQERGLDINSLGLRPEVRIPEPMSPFDEDMLPHNPTIKPPDNE